MNTNTNSRSCDRRDKSNNIVTFVGLDARLLVIHMEVVARVWRRFDYCGSNARERKIKYTIRPLYKLPSEGGGGLRKFHRKIDKANEKLFMFH